MRPKDPILRSPTLICYCCPPNLARTIAELGGWAYSRSADALWVNLYGGNTLSTALAGGALKLAQDTEYPWEGRVRFQVEQAPADEFALMLRIPAWAEGATFQVNREGPRQAAAGAYAEIRRKWRGGDIIELRLPMEPRLVVANPYVEITRGQAAVMRGPVVYALESPDLPPGVRFTEVALPKDVKFEPRRDPQLLGGVTVLHCRAKVFPEGEWSGLLYRTLRPAPERLANIRLIPYYAWANRGVSYMTVWTPLSR
jgi:DUF1680 family protein